MDSAADVRDNRQAYRGEAMKRYLIFGILVAGVLSLALLGWAVSAVRWTLTGSAKRRGADGFAPVLT
jgi:hypothetical protein